MGGCPDDEETERAEDPAYRAIYDAARELLDTLVDTNRAIVLRVGGREVYMRGGGRSPGCGTPRQPLPMGVR
ncbi:hypothetical protein QJS66_17240 [Kocuria rhizophila]|nr:hypothetical protein QJS66_17240 [Kocuria rhizophila]